MKIKLRLLTPEDVREFVSICSQYDYDIDMKDGSIIIDAKSYLGVMAAATKRQMSIVCASEDITLMHRLKKFAAA
ncbi:MAG: HPr family phosphocarrier protein [Lachnospiraceae bacterium]|nr:HPr family phosphocarrier protein [Lachnospiraceae bacterium]MBQ6258694.1 HPr family phosphocarrier protein [Lachnospiraceae bacterium]